MSKKKLKALFSAAFKKKKSSSHSATSKTKNQHRTITPKSNGPWDGKLSIEHQLDIHILDLLHQLGQCNNNETPLNNQEIIIQTLNGLQYIMEYRFKGREPNLSIDSEIAKKLVHVLLLLSPLPTQSSFSFKPSKSDEAKLAIAELSFNLLADYSEHVQECSQSLEEVPIPELVVRLSIDDRLDRLRENPLNIHAMEFLPPVLSLLINLPDTKCRQIIRKKKNIQFLQSNNFLQTLELSPPPLQTNEAITLFPPTSTLWLDRTTTQLLKMFRILLPVGLSNEEDLSLRKMHYGSNVLPPPLNTKGPFRLLLEQFKDSMILILTGSALVSLLFDWPDWHNSFVIMVVIFCNVGMGAWEEGRARRTCELLGKEHAPLMVRVRRFGAETLVPQSNLVPGDLVFLEEGDRVPADLRLLGGIDLVSLDDDNTTTATVTSVIEVNESILTGESIPVSKKSSPIPCSESRFLPITKCSNVLFQGTWVVRGHGLAIALRTGNNTELGHIGNALDTGAEERAPHKWSLQSRLSRLSFWLVLITVVLCSTVLFLGFRLNLMPLEQLVRITVSLAISVIPEGLLAALTIGMALAVRRLSKPPPPSPFSSFSSYAAENNIEEGTLVGSNSRCSGGSGSGGGVLIKDFTSFQSLAVGTVLATDKTGTLTEGKMRLSSIWIPSSSSSSLEDILSCMVLCNNVRWTKNETKYQVIGGESTERAIVEGAFEEWDRSFKGEEPNITNPTTVPAPWESFKRISEVPFTSERRMMSVICRKELNNGSGGGVIFTKGAIESVLECCAFSKNSSSKQEIIEAEKAQSLKGHRVLALAYKNIKADDSLLAPQHQENHLTFLSLVVLADPPREGVKEAIRQLKESGIHICMITGDNERTAVSVARMVGIITSEAEHGTTDTAPPSTPSYRILKGSDVEWLGVDGLLSLGAPFPPTIVSRASPHQKMLLIEAMQRAGEIVVMTGDGVNDAPAIRRADVGVAMHGASTSTTSTEDQGSSSTTTPSNASLCTTQITKDAADIILLDDKLQSLVRAIKEGRLVERNVRLFLIYLLSCNSSEIWSVLLGILIWGDSPLSAMNILWANIIADIPPSLALALERNDSSSKMMLKTPQQVSNDLMASQTWILILCNGLTMSLLTLGSLYSSYGETTVLSQEMRSETFLILFGLQLFMAFLCRSTTESFFSSFGSNGGGAGGRNERQFNYWLLGAVSLSMMLLVAGIYVPHLNAFLDLTPVSPMAWWRLFECMVAMLIVNEVLKAFILR